MRYLPCDRGDSYSLEITAGMKQEDIKDNYTYKSSHPHNLLYKIVHSFVS